MRRVALVAAALAAAALAVAAAAAQSSGSAGKTTITFWTGFTGRELGIVKGVVAQFEQSHPSIAVKTSHPSLARRVSAVRRIVLLSSITRTLRPCRPPSACSLAT